MHRILARLLLAPLLLSSLLLPMPANALPPPPPWLAELDALYDAELRVDGLETRTFSPEQWWEMALPLVEGDRAFEIETIGRSVEGRPLRHVAWGEGGTSVLLWSQMHGDESTASMALADLLHFLGSRPDHPLVQRLRAGTTLHVFPIVNPDGAARFQRRNAQGVDINRDARALATPEGQALHALRERLQPDFGFNLHDQNVGTRVGDTDRGTAIALLAPAFNEAREVDAIRGRAIEVAVAIQAVLEPYVPGHLAKWDDTFNPRAFGDLTAAAGVSTILIESGGIEGDLHKQQLRKLNFLALVGALDAIATGAHAGLSHASYLALPENGDTWGDLLVTGGTLAVPGQPRATVDVAVDFRDPFFERDGTVRDVGDLRHVRARRVVDASGQYIVPAGRFAVGAPADFVVSPNPDGSAPTLALASSAAPPAAPASAATAIADMVLLGGRIWTGDATQPEAQALAIVDGKVVAVGSDAAIRRWAGDGTQVVELHGRRVVPGFNDAHVHFFDGGQGLASVQLRDAPTPEVFRDRIAAHAATLPKGQWILNGNWDHENWTPADLPTRQLIDAVTPDNPVFINRLDGHMALANTLALELAGITRDTPDPPGGTIVRDANGEPTGVLKDAAMNAVYAVIPEASDPEIETALRAAMRYANEHGVTSVQDMSAGPDVLRAYRRLLEAGELTVRVHGAQPLSRWERLAGPGITAGFGDDRLRIGILKGFADGSLGSTTALFHDPYVDAPHTHGLPSDELVEYDAMLADMVGADAAGLQLALHAIGDKANATILDMFAEVAARNGPRERRWRIEHAQHIAPADLPRFQAQGVIASMQPYHAIDDGRWAEKRIGPERIKGTYAFRSLLDAGAVLAFGSDWYVAPIPPLMGIYAAATRRTLDGANPDGWVPEQKITVEEALRAYTWGSAYASGEEATKGTLAPGMLADLVVLSDDILAIDPAAIADARVDLTVVGGAIVHQRADGSTPR